ncbi:MAG: hypothetical protein ACKO3F_03255 [Cyanobium sp.]
MNLHSQVRKRLNSYINSNAEGRNALEQSLRLLCKWRSALIQNTLIHHHGTMIHQGPFKGLDFLPQSAEGCHIAKLLGCYEQPLHESIENAIKKQYEIILNIGCAEGYYAIGMALRMRNALICAHDLNANAQRVCAELAIKNKVSDRVKVGGLFNSTDFNSYAGKSALVICDIEGAELELLDPDLAPSLRGMDLIVESHECIRPGITAALTSRFRSSHRITLVQDDGQRNLDNAPEWFKNLAHLDQLLATWEWRSGPTPWLVMQTTQNHN